MREMKSEDFHVLSLRKFDREAFNFRLRRGINLEPIHRPNELSN